MSEQKPVDPKEFFVAARRFERLEVEGRFDHQTISPQDLGAYVIFLQYDGATVVTFDGETLLETMNKASNWMERGIGE